MTKEPRRCLKTGGEGKLRVDYIQPQKKADLNVKNVFCLKKGSLR